MTGVMRDADASHDDALSRLGAVDTSLLDDHALLDHLAAVERVIAAAQSLQLRGLADFARRPARIERVGDDLAAASAEWAPVGRWVRAFADDEVAARLHISRVDAAARIDTGCALTALPATSSALVDGRIDLRRARVLVEETRALDADAARSVEAALIVKAEHLPAARLRPLARRAAIAADPVAAERRERRAREGRRVLVTPLADGMAELTAHLPAADAMAIKSAITAAARASKRAAAPGDDRSMDQRMADALSAPFVDALATGELAGTGLRLAHHRGRAAELQVLVSADTLLGRGEGAAELVGYGAITASTARELAPDARWRRVLVDPPSGTVLDVGTRVYRPPNDLTRHVETRGRRCVFPGCGWAATACDLDHVVPFPRGSTSADNLVPLCRRHHRFKQSTGVRIERSADGTVRWTMPTGHRRDQHGTDGDVAHDEGGDTGGDGGNGSPRASLRPGTLDRRTSTTRSGRRHDRATLGGAAGPGLSPPSRRARS